MIKKKKKLKKSVPLNYTEDYYSVLNTMLSYIKHSTSINSQKKMNIKEILSRIILPMFHKYRTHRSPIRMHTQTH